ncbi:hypothetical protein O181_093002 [Austropuccinia psidii MF-1]|uniref:CCHC-type domain-containing protein n=1 Tax=Austropuccinia psidii MF-1 TaxID=1389203 RepID=A0A9Q3J079_9BASI|nr:hypothetical protein [Austropuccinia psidii MF-1]
MRKAIDHSSEIHVEDILEIANQIQEQSALDTSKNILLLQMDVGKNASGHSWQSAPTPKTNPILPSLSSNSPSPLNSIDRKSEDWKRKWLTTKSPCFYCGKVGHWLLSCPTRRWWTE